MRYTPATRVRVLPFTRQEDDGDFIIGRPETGAFLSIPGEAVGVLDALTSGKTVGEAGDLYREAHGETVDLEDFLLHLESKGLVCPIGAANDTAGAVAPQSAPLVRHHFANFPQELARRIFGPVSLTLSGALVLLALAAVVYDPKIVPGPSAFYFAEHRVLKILTLMVVGSFTLFLHEMGHLIAARAVNVDSRLGIGNRLWILVAETDLTGLWSVSKRQRYLPLLAGPIVDATSAAVLLLFLAAARLHWISPSPLAIEMARAFCFSYLMALLWQCLLFVRTDFYYVISTYFNCKSLLRDTETYLRNRLARVVSSISPIDQSHVPAPEMRVIRGYAWIWLFGRALAFGSLFFMSLPLAWTYIREIGQTLGTGFAASPYAFLDSLALTALSLIPFTIGLWVWSASLVRSWRKSRAERLSPA